MEPEAMKNLELDKICRCCLTVKKEMRPLFGELIAEMLTDCIQIHVERTDGWPDKICMQCVQQVSRFHSFKKRLEKMDNQLREYIKGLTVVVEEQIQVPPEIALTKIALPSGLAGPQFITRTANGGHQLINGGSMFSQPVQIQSNGQLMHHSAQLIPVQMLPNNQTQVVQIQRTSDETCEIIMRPQGLPRIQTLPGVSSLGSAVTTNTTHHIDHAQQYYEETIASKDIEEILDDDDDEEDEEEAEEDHEEDLDHEESGELEDCDEAEPECEEEPNYVVEEIPESEIELEIDHQHQQHSHDQVSSEIEVYVEDEEEAAEEVDPELIVQSVDLCESPHPATPFTTNSPHLIAVQCDNHAGHEQSTVSISDSEGGCDEDDGADSQRKEFMAEFITLQTSCPAPGRHVCNLCHKEFKFSKWLHSHMKSHSNWIKANCKRQPECEVCHKKFKGPGMLKMHMKTHEARVLQCELCLKPFQNEYHLNLHMEKHNNVDSNSFKCVPCSMTFISANDMRIHKRTHGIKAGRPSQQQTAEHAESTVPTVPTGFTGPTGHTSNTADTGHTGPLWKVLKRQKIQLKVRP